MVFKTLFFISVQWGGEGQTAVCVSAEKGMHVREALPGIIKTKPLALCDLV